MANTKPEKCVIKEGLTRRNMRAANPADAFRLNNMPSDTVFTLATGLGAALADGLSTAFCLKSAFEIQAAGEIGVFGIVTTDMA